VTLTPHSTSPSKPEGENRRSYHEKQTDPTQVAFVSTILKYLSANKSNNREEPKPEKYSVDGESPAE